MLELLSNIFSYSAYTSLAYVVYSYCNSDKQDLSNLTYAKDQLEYHRRLANYYQRAIAGGSCKKLN